MSLTLFEASNPVMTRAPSNLAGIPEKVKQPAHSATGLDMRIFHST